MFCPDCGSEVAEGRKFCGKCGAKFNTDAVENEPAAVATKQPAKKVRRWSILMLVGFLILLFLGYHWWNAGFELRIVTHESNQSMMTIILDGRSIDNPWSGLQYGPGDYVGIVNIPHVPFGRHELSFAHDGHTEITKGLDIWPWSPEFSGSTVDDRTGGSETRGGRFPFWSNPYTEGYWPFLSAYTLEYRSMRIVR
jgi:hypothetical protein